MDDEIVANAENLSDHEYSQNGDDDNSSEEEEDGVEPDGIPQFDGFMDVSQISLPALI